MRAMCPAHIILFIRPPSIIWGRVQFMKFHVTPPSCSSRPPGFVLYIHHRIMFVKEPKCFSKGCKTKSSARRAHSRLQNQDGRVKTRVLHSSRLTRNSPLSTLHFSERRVTGVEWIILLSYKNCSSHNHKSKHRR